MLIRKIVITGYYGVGKSSLFNRFLYGSFFSDHQVSYGIKVDKKTIKVEGSRITLNIWDVAGQLDLEKIPKSYLDGASAIIFIVDLARPATWMNLAEDMSLISRISPAAVIKVVGNKVDMTERDEMPKDTIESQTGIPVMCLTSAKTGENVEELFYTIGRELLEESKTG